MDMRKLIHKVPRPSMSACQVHRHYSHTPLDVHHIMPQAEGGPTRADNLIVLCATGHREVHEYLRLLQIWKSEVPWAKRRLYGPKVRKCALLGYERLLEGWPPTDQHPPAST